MDSFPVTDDTGSEHELDVSFQAVFMYCDATGCLGDLHCSVLPSYLLLSDSLYRLVVL